MEDAVAQITIIDLLWLLGATSAVGVFCAMVWRWLKPIRDLNAKVEELMRRSELDYKRLQDLNKRQSIIGEALWAVMSHIAEGNHSGEMKKALLNLSKDLMFNDTD